MRNCRHGPDEVFPVLQITAVDMDNGTPPEFTRLGEQVDDHPVRQPRHQQTHQTVQDLFNVHRRGQLGSKLGQQRQALQLGQRFLDRTGLRVLQWVKERQHAPSAAVVVSGHQPRHRRY